MQKSFFLAAMFLAVLATSSARAESAINCYPKLITLGGHSSHIYSSSQSLIDSELVGTASVTINFTSEHINEHVVVQISNTTTLDQFVDSYNAQAAQSSAYAANTGSMQLQTWGILVVPNTKLKKYGMTAVADYPSGQGFPRTGAFNFIEIFNACDWPSMGSLRE